MSRKSIVAKGLLAVVILAIGAAGFLALVRTKPRVDPAKPEERVWSISAQTVEIGDVQPTLVLFGEVVAGREVELRALVSDEVVAVANSFRDGGRIEAGHLLVEIDPFEYQAAVDERQAELEEARAKTDEIKARQRAEQESLVREREILTLREREIARISRLYQTGNVSQKSVDDTNMRLSSQRMAVSSKVNALAAEQAKARQQTAATKRKQVLLRRAERDLTRTRLVAPFTGYLSNTTAEVGRRLNVNDRIGELIEAGNLEVRVHVSDAEYRRLLNARDGLIGRRATVMWQSAADTDAYQARVDRTGPRIDATTGGVDLYARIALPDGDRLLKPGAFVSVHLPDRVYADVITVPESAVFGDTHVYVVENGRLQRRPITIVGRNGDKILLRGDLRAGETVSVTRFAEIGPGTAVAVLP
jgi:RND family efflux transporter MFP subunit